MTIEPTPPLHAFIPAALAASQVGTWEYDSAADRFRCDETAALLYGLSDEEAERGVPIDQVRTRCHPEDRPTVIAEYERAVRYGGLIVLEFRMLSRQHGLRWLLSRGRYEMDDRGRGAVGRGIVIDVTASKADGYADGRAHFLAVDLMADVPRLLDRMAELALELRRIVERIGGRTGALLSPLIDALLYAVGRQIAARLGTADAVEDGSEHGHERMH